jgi:hypothetical protein
LLQSKKNDKSIISLMMLLSLIYLTVTPTEFSGLNNIDYTFAQGSSLDLIQISSASSYTDEFGNFHIIGEVNNTSPDPQTNIVVTAILSDTTTNSSVGNHSAFSSIETLRSGELSPFDIVIQNPQQILGKFNFMEFSTTSQPTSAEKPASLVLNGSSSFIDNVGNPHITGNIINQGQSPEQLLNLVATFYDNSSLGVVGTQSFGLNVGGLTNNQMAPFDITIADNKTKSQAAFYSLNVDSAQSSMSAPFNPKFSLTNSDSNTGQFITTGESANPLSNNNPLLNNNQGITNQNLQPINTDDDNTNDDNENDNNDNQRGEDKRDDNGNPWFDDDNCSEESGSSGGSLSECEEAEREEQNEQEDEDSLDDNNDNNDGNNNESINTDENSGEGEENSGEGEENN